MAITDKLAQVEARYLEIESALADPSVASDRQNYAKLSKEYKNLTPVIEKFREYTSVKSASDEAEELMKPVIEEIKKLINIDLTDWQDTEKYEDKDFVDVLQDMLRCFNKNKDMKF